MPATRQSARSVGEGPGSERSDRRRRDDCPPTECQPRACTESTLLCERYTCGLEGLPGAAAAREQTGGEWSEPGGLTGARGGRGAHGRDCCPGGRAAFALRRGARESTLVSFLRPNRFGKADRSRKQGDARLRPALDAGFATSCPVAGLLPRLAAPPAFILIASIGIYPLHPRCPAQGLAAVSSRVSQRVHTPLLAFDPHPCSTPHPCSPSPRPAPCTGAAAAEPEPPHAGPRPVPSAAHAAPR